MSNARVLAALGDAWLVLGVYPLVKLAILWDDIERATGSRLLAIGFVLACLLLYAVPIGYLTRRASCADLDQQQ